jgi:ubiquinone/menaquinone biosynthesis C-methylase UbiE
MFLRLVKLLSEHRYRNLIKIDRSIIWWDVRRGLPFPENVFDVIYHSHFLTHLERDHASRVMKESHRILKPGGILRIVIPDLEQIVNLYNDAIKAIQNKDPSGYVLHKRAVAELFELMVRTEPFGTGKQNVIAKYIEYLVRGDIHGRGELRRWQYDRYSLKAMMNEAGFRDTFVLSATTSHIKDWNHFRLDIEEDGSIYKPDSLYVEGLKQS